MIEFYTFFSKNDEGWRPITKDRNVVIEKCLDVLHFGFFGLVWGCLKSSTDRTDLMRIHPEEALKDEKSFSLGSHSRTQDVDDGIHSLRRPIPKDESVM